MKYFMIGGDKREYGPVEAEGIREWIREGRANGDTLLRAESEPEWKPLRSFPEFQAELPQAAAPAGTPPPIPTIITVSMEAPIRVRHAFARAWHLVNEHFGVIALACLMAWMALTAMLFVPYVGQILAMIFYGPVFGGLSLLFLKLIREGEASSGDVFALARDKTMPLMMTGIISILITELATACCCVLPGIYLQIAWLFAIPLVADKSLNFWGGLEISRRVITPHWFKFCGLFIVAFLPVVVFHFYMTGRIAADLSASVSELLRLLGPLLEGGTPNESQIQGVMKQIDEIQSGYASWAFVKQCLLLISMPLGIGSLACVYEDLFGAKK